MKMLLNGFETSFWDPIGYAFSEVAKVDYGHEYIHVALGEGTYTLTLLDDTDAAVPVPALDCQPFELALELVPEEALTSCDDAQVGLVCFPCSVVLFHWWLIQKKCFVYFLTSTT